MQITLSPKPSVHIDTAVPGDKSISHRCAILGAIAEGEAVLNHFGPGLDCQSTLYVLQQSGVKVRQKGTQVKIAGVGYGGFRKSTAPLNCGNSGTTARLMMGAMAGQSFQTVLTGDASLSRRPMRRLMEPLMAMGAKIESNSGGTLPVQIRGTTLRGISYTMPVASAQVKSGILLAGLHADGKTKLTEPQPTRDHTERLLEVMSGKRISGPRGLEVSRGMPLKNITMDIPGDVSSAAFLVAAAVVLPGSETVIRRVGLNPTRIRFLKILKELGADVLMESNLTPSGEPVGQIVARGHARRLRRFRLHGEDTAHAIDEIPILAVVAACCGDGLEVRDAEELRVKECDRIKAIVSNLQALGANVTAFEDGFCVEPSRLHGGDIDSYGDHRIAMAMAVAALTCQSECRLNGAECVDVSFPTFFDHLTH